MSTFNVKPAQFQKVQGSVTLESTPSDKLVEMIVKVKVNGYVPPNVKVRSRVDPTMFTGEAFMDELHRLEADPKVTSVSVSKPLRLID